MLSASRFKNSRVYCERPWSLSALRDAHCGCIGHAFIAFWGIVLFGYDTFVGLALSKDSDFAYLENFTAGLREVRSLRFLQTGPTG